MKRLGIFVFYDRAGIADNYVYYLLDSMKEIVDRIMIAVNGYVCSDSLKKFHEYAEDIIIRENVDYDAGAYKEIITGLAANNELDNWDEIVLFNNTFYGPFFDWQIIFGEMEERDVDFWGLSKWKRGRAEWFGGELPEHLQSYFLVVGKRMLTSKFFLEFWQNLGSLSTYYDAIYHFEVMFTVYHSGKGFRYASWLDEDTAYTRERETVYLVHPYDLVRECRFPILKKRAVTVTNFLQAGAALQYIESTFRYDIKMIWDHIKRVESIEAKEYFSFIEVEHFIDTRKKIYIYGYGKWGHAVESLFRYKGWKIAGIIDADTSKQNGYIRKLEDIPFESEDGVIVAVGKEVFGEVYLKLKDRLKEGQLLLPHLQ